MTYINNEYWIPVLGYDNDYLYYHDCEPGEEMEPPCRIPIIELKNKYYGGLKLNTIIKYQKEIGLINNHRAFLKDNCQLIPFLSQIILNHETAIKEYNTRVILFESEGSGPVSAWIDYLYLRIQNGYIELYSSRNDYLTAFEIVEYYGLGDSDYWYSLQPNGEVINSFIDQIKKADELYESILTLLVGAEQWNIKKEQINWDNIIDNLLKNKGTIEIGRTLKSKVNEQGIRSPE